MLAVLSINHLLQLTNYCMAADCYTMVTVLLGYIDCFITSMNILLVTSHYAT